MSDPGLYGRRFPLRQAIAVFLLVFSAAVPAVDRALLAWELLEGNGWSLHDASLVLDWSIGEQPILGFSARRIDFGSESLENIRLRCAEFEVTRAQIDCPRGRLDVDGRLLQAKSIPAQFRYSRVSGALSLSVTGLSVAGGHAGLRLENTAAGWQLEAQLHNLDLARLATLSGSLGVALPALEPGGQVGGKLTLDGDERGLVAARWEVRTVDAGYSNAAGDQAAEALLLTSRGHAALKQGNWIADVALDARQGMLYADPVYLEFSAGRPLLLSAALRWYPDGRLRVPDLTLRQPGVVAARASGVLRPSAVQPLQKLEVEIEQARLPAFYTTWLQPWLAGSALEEVDTQGQLQGRLRLSEGRIKSLRLQLDALSFHDTDGQFGAEGLTGNLLWDNSGEWHESQLGWNSLAFYQLKTGPATLLLKADRQHVKLVKPLSVPLLDGALRVDEFEAGRDTEGMHWLLDGQLTPVSMHDFSTALGWPPLAGKLSGMVPKMRYEKGVLTLGGILLVQAFKGDITLRHLRIEQPLGLVPRLWLDARMEGVDLKTLTKTFSFGRIEGRVRGEVNGLYMEAWQPVSFDAFIGTPENDASRHRISQRAIDNISNLGGAGVSGALSRSFLRLFEDFPYKRLGIRCRLENTVCHMGGIAPAEQGYYLVQGRFLPPRLDVIGYQQEVDWQSLLDRLTAVTAGNAPLIE